MHGENINLSYNGKFITTKLVSLGSRMPHNSGFVMLIPLTI